MSRNGDKDNASPRFDVEDTTNNNEEGSKTGASTDANLKTS
jgi:hypothetical protein